MRLRPWMAAACVTAVGCGAPSPADPDLKSDVARIRGHTPDADYAYTLEFEPGFFDGNLAALSADVGRCHVTADDAGLSRLEYPTTATTRPATTGPTTFNVEIGPGGPFEGDVPLVGDADHPTPFPNVRSLFGVAFGLPQFMHRPFDALPDRLAAAVAGPGPVAPALVDLARELADSPAVGVVGTLRDTGLFAGQLTASAAARAKLRAALARHDAATRPATPGSTGLRPATR